MHRLNETKDRLLDLIYDAATEPELWQSVLTKIADLTSSQGGILFGQSTRTVYFEYNGRMSEECNRTYREHHMHNAWSTAMASQPLGRLVLSDEVVPLAPLKRTAFYDDVLRPQDVAHNAMIALDARHDFVVAFNLCQSARRGPLGATERAFVNSLAPHLRRAFRLTFRTEGYRNLQKAEFHVLDHLALGILLLDTRRRVIYANAAVRSVAEGGVLRFRSSGVATYSPAHSQRLDALIHAALRGAPSGAMSIPRPSDGQLLTIVVSSIRGRDVDRFADFRMQDAAIMLYIVDPANRPGIPPSWIMDGFGLTKAEAKVALAIASALTIPETGIRLGISENTVKTHLRRVYAKTGTGRQSDLARLLATLGLLGAHGLSA